MNKMPLLLLLLAACGSNSSTEVDAGILLEDPIDASIPIDAIASIDQDEDGISDIEEGIASDRDSDMDSTPDYLDTDSDNDSIPDALEAGDDDIETAPVDSDGDLTPDYLDTDSDEDCILDAVEAGDDDLSTAPLDTDQDTLADYVDTDSDADWLLDSTEDSNCDGNLDQGESSRLLADTDSDGDSDLVETVMESDLQNPKDNSVANGTPVFLSPHQVLAEPTSHEIATSTDISRLDVYIVTDRSGSLTVENANLRNNITTVANNILCPPLGTGTPGQCLDDVWWGTGSVGYRGTNGQPYVHALDLQPDPTLISNAISTTEPSGCCDEPLLLGVHSAITGGDSTGDGTCTVNSPYPARADCTGSPADLDGSGGFGYPCFRDDALSLLVLVTDEAPTLTHNCPSIPVVGAVAQNAGVFVAGVNANSNGQVLVQSDLEALATQSGAVDVNNANAPIVVAGSDDQTATALETAIKAIAQNTAVDVSLELNDDDSDAVDTLVSFVERIETNQSGVGACTSGLTDSDTDMDTFNDVFQGVPASTPLCFNIISKTNESVEEQATPGRFKLDLTIRANDRVHLSGKSVFFIVPPIEAF